MGKDKQVKVKSETIVKAEVTPSEINTVKAKLSISDYFTSKLAQKYAQSVPKLESASGFAPDAQENFYNSMMNISQTGRGGLGMSSHVSSTSYFSSTVMKPAVKLDSSDVSVKISKVEEFEEVVPVLELKSKKSKKHRSSEVTIDVGDKEQETISTEIEITVSEEPKMKKKKSKVSEEASIGDENNENSKKKKKKMECEPDESVAEEPIKKIKKSKRILDIDEDVSEETILKNKKSKNAEIDVEAIEIKKPKKHRNPDMDDHSSSKKSKH